MREKQLEAIQILLTADENYAVHIPTLLKSLQVNHPSRPFQIHLISDGLPDELLSALRAFCEKLHYGFSHYTVSEELFAEAPVNKHYSKAMYYRMLAFMILPENVDRVLYLDPDVLVINSIAPLWEMDMKGCLFAAASHRAPDGIVSNVNNLRLDTSSAYYNTGVLLMDLAQCRKQIQTQEIFLYVRENDYKLLLPDQDVFNALFGDRTIFIPDEIWNYDARRYSEYLLRSGGQADENWVIRHTAILHFCGKEKPWSPRYRYRFGILYRHYRQLCRIEEER
mgnify:FL=1